MKRVELYSLYERTWHWLQAVSIALLSVTGFEIHFSGTVHLFGFAAATHMHEALALFTIANGFLSLFYHLATGAIRQFVPQPRDALSMGIVQLRYYLVGMFNGEPHPFVRGPEQKLNVLQQLTYLAILNLLLPLQLITGALMWRASQWVSLVDALGGLRVLATVHVGVAWLFVAFVIMHVYLTTTGHTPFAHIKAMVLGYEASEETSSNGDSTHRTHSSSEDRAS
jgi:thiosulfate reductase cytochrome b subunit